MCCKENYTQGQNHSDSPRALVEYNLHVMIFFYDANLQSDIFRTYALIETNTLWKATKVKFMLNLAKI